MNLNECTHKELIWIVTRLLQRCGIEEVDYQLDRAIAELEDAREELRKQEEEERARREAEIWNDYEKLMEPYKGKSSFEIPTEILRRGYELQRQLKR